MPVHRVASGVHKEPYYLTEDKIWNKYRPAPSQVLVLSLGRIHYCQHLVRETWMLSFSGLFCLELIFLPFMSGSVTASVIEKNASQGWTSTPNWWGTWDIFSSCLLTTVLCCWTSVCPNILALSDGRWVRFRDKLGLACIGLLGPEFLFMLALGEWTSARRSVKLCSLVCYTTHWC